MELGYEIAKLLPWNHYSRKNIGYLFAMEQGAKIIYETDDDNEAIGLLNFCPSPSVLPSLRAEGSALNIYGYFGRPEIWPRGFPLDQIHPPRPFEIFPPEEHTIGAEQGIVNGSPDVDAIFRLTQDRDVQFEARPPCALPRGVFCPFNSQNTFFHPVAFFTMYLPSHVSMRVSDIWRGYIAQSLMWKCGARLVFSGPNAVQLRNEHSLLHDFYLEQALYLQSHKLVKHLGQWDLLPSEDPSAMMTSLFQGLVEAQFFPPEEMGLLKAWLHDLERVSF